MQIGSVFLILALILGVGMYVVQPFLERRNRKMTAEVRGLSALMAERDRVVNALQELDFDFNLNKIPAEDYPVQRTALLQKGADILKQLDALTPNVPASKGNGAADRIESAVAARRADLASAKTVRDDDDVEALIAARRTSRKEKSGGFCPRCGKPVLASDRFCPHCGKSIS
jgi:NADH pyrophosphatase NudC (nudix superfamily)